MYLLLNQNLSSAALLVLKNYLKVAFSASIVSSVQEHPLAQGHPLHLVRLTNSFIAKMYPFGV